MKTADGSAGAMVLTAAQMRASEAREIGSGRTTGQALMERAGAGALAAALELWPDLATAPGRAVVLCGPGNNGGDGYVVARLLDRRGWSVTVAHFGPEAPAGSDAAAARAAWPGPAQPFDAGAVTDDLRDADLAVDALFGTGLTRGLPAGIAPLREGWQVARRKLALDLPSGLSSDTGRDLGGALAADLTATFHTPKPGHYLADGPDLCGRLAVVPIGLPAPGQGVRLAGPDRAALAKRGGHKYESGHLLVLGGGPGRGGAARMAARAGLRIGAGLVTLSVPPDAVPENAARLDAVMLRPLRDARALSRMLQGDARLNALCLGPGLGAGDDGAEASRALVLAALDARRATVLDADALTVFADTPHRLFEALHPQAVLTPHGGEFARLFPDLARRMVDDGATWSKVDAAVAAARRAGCTILLKGADTVIADAAGEVRLAAAAYGRAAPWLATAGAGDVLAGLIAGLLARGVPPLAAAENAAWLHVEAALALGPGLIAEDLPEALPAALRRVLR